MKVKIDGEIRKRYDTKSFVRFLNHIASTKNQNALFLIRLNYGRKVCVNGCLCLFYNESVWENKKDAIEMTRYFNQEV